MVCKKKQLEGFSLEITSNYHQEDVVDSELMLTASEPVSSTWAGGEPGQMGGVADTQVCLV